VYTHVPYVLYTQLGLVCFESYKEPLFRLTKHSPKVFIALLESPVLSLCRQRGEDADCQVRPAWCTFRRTVISGDKDARMGPTARSGWLWVVGFGLCLRLQENKKRRADEKRHEDFRTMNELERRNKEENEEHRYPE
jgi:hypothetical protein